MGNVFILNICWHSNNILLSVVFSPWKCEYHFYRPTSKLKKCRSSSKKYFVEYFFLFIFPLNKYISLISSFFKTHFKINFKMIFVYLFILLFFLGGNFPKNNTMYKRRIALIILAQESRWEIINNILEPEERKISISHDHTLQIVRNPLPINPFMLLLYLKPKKVPVRLSSGASPPMSSQVSSHVNLLHSVQVHKHY